MTHLEGAQQRLVHAHHRTRIIKFAAIVGRREERDQVPFRKKFVPVLDHLFTITIRKHTRNAVASPVTRWRRGKDDSLDALDKSDPYHASAGTSKRHRGQT